MAFKLVVGFNDLKATITYSKLRSTVTYQELAAANVKLDADTLNRYFTVSTNSTNAVSVSISETTALTVGKARADIANINETLAFNTNLGTSDSIAFGESVHTLVTFIRAFSDSASVGAEISTISFGKNATDSATILESANVKLIPNRGLNVAAINSSTLN